MPDNLLNILKFFLVALIWLFFLRASRAVWVEARTKVAALPDTAGAVGGAAGLTRRGMGARPPIPAGAPRSSAATGKAAGTPGSPAYLTVTKPPELEGSIYALEDDECVIGRASGCAVPIEEDTFVSHLHARIFKRGEELWVEDLGSTNGTYLNGKRLSSPLPLRSGDALHVGHTWFEVTR